MLYSSFKMVVPLDARGAYLCRRAIHASMKQ